MTTELNENGMLVLRTLMALENREATEWPVPLHEIIEAAADIQNVDQFAAPNFNHRIEEGLRALVDLEVVQGPGPLWGSIATVFSMIPGVEGIINELMGISVPALWLDAPRLRTSMLAYRI